MKTLTPLTAPDLLQVGHWFRREDHLFEIIAWEAKNPLHVEARAAEGGTLQRFTLTELFAPQPVTRFAATSAELTAPPENGDTPSQVVDAATLPPHLLQHADHLIQTVEAVQAGIARARQHAQRTAEPFMLTEATRQACQQLASPLSLSGYYKYRRLYQEGGGDRGRIAAALRRNTHGKTRFDANTHHFLDTIMQRFYRSNPPLRAQTVYTLAQQLWEHNQHWWLNYQQEAGQAGTELVEHLLDPRQEINALLTDPVQRLRLTQIRMPSQTWFYGYVKWASTQPGEGVQTYMTRYGKADWEANFLLFDHFVQTATLPLQYVFADHYQLDVVHVDDAYREPLGRLWLTVLIDAFSRAVLGFLLAYEAPCIESIQGALRHAIWPKGGLEAVGLELPWSCYGIPQRLLLDNAWAHHSYSLEDLARALAGGGRYTQLELVFRPPYQARYGALVERVFGNLSGQIRELLPGAVLPPDQRAWHKAHQAACLLYQDLNRIMHQLIVTYLHTPHRELAGLTPHEKWLQGLALMTPVLPPLTPHLERSFWRLHPETRLATQTGLALFGMHYWEVPLAGLRGPDPQGKRRSFHLRYDPADVSRVAVFENGLWLGDGYARELRLPDGSYEPVSLWELELAKNLVQTRSPGQVRRPQAWLIYLLEARELIVQRQAEQKLIRRKVQQLRARRPGRPASVPLAERQALEGTQVHETEQVLASQPPQGDDPRTRLLATLKEVL